MCIKDGRYWDFLKLTGDLIGDSIHGILDILGFLPVVGAAADGLNAVIFFAQGEHGAALLCLGAAVPFIGDAFAASKLAVRYGADALKSGKAMKSLSNAGKEIGGVLKSERGAITIGKRIPPPKELKGFEGLRKAKPKTSVQGGGGKRARWKDKQGNIYEWDSQHGTVEKYNKRGKHLGEFDPNTGRQIKPANPNRKVEP